MAIETYFAMPRIVVGKPISNEKPTRNPKNADTFTNLKMSADVTETVARTPMIAETDTFTNEKAYSGVVIMLAKRRENRGDVGVPRVSTDPDDD